MSNNIELTNTFGGAPVRVPNSCACGLVGISQSAAFPMGHSLKGCDILSNQKGSHDSQKDKDRDEDAREENETDRGTKESRRS